MANTKISALTANTNPNGSEEFVYAYNNANGKITLNTMKTFIGSGGGGGGGDAAFDAVVDAGGGGDYTSVSAAIAAGKYNIFVKNGSYTETAGWNPYGASKSFLRIVGESESGVQITMPSTMTTANGIMIDMRYGNAADFYMENITFDITLTSTNKTFYKDNGGTNFIVKNCSFTYTTNVTTPTASQHHLFYTKVINDASNVVEGGRVYSGLYGCYFNTETTKIINIGYGVMVAMQCKFYSAAGRIQLAQETNKAKLYNCYVNAYELGGLYEIEVYNSYVEVAYNVYDGNGNNLRIESIDASIFKLGTLQNAPTISIGECTDSELNFGTYDISGALTFNNMEALRSNCRITCGEFKAGNNVIGCDVSATTMTIVSGNSRIIGCRFRNTLTSATFNANGGVISGNIFNSSSGTITLSGDGIIFTDNQAPSMTLSDTGTGNVKANNIIS